MTMKTIPVFDLEEDFNNPLKDKDVELNFNKILELYIHDDNFDKPEGFVDLVVKHQGVPGEALYATKQEAAEEAVNAFNDWVKRGRPVS